MRRPPASRAQLGKAEPKDFFGVDKDIDAFTRTIQRYLTKYQRWNSPKFIIGESYGTTRAAGLVQLAARRGRSTQRHRLRLDRLQLRRFQGDQSLINFLPTYAADAWYYGKIAGKPPLESFVDQAREFARGPYALALQKGNLISDGERQSVAQQMAQLTGLSPDYIVRSNLRVDPESLPARAASRSSPDHRPDRFALRRDRARYHAAKQADYDPQGSSITGAFVGALNDYLFRDLGYKTPLVYRPNNYGAVFGGGGPDGWSFQHKGPTTGSSRLPTPAKTSPMRCGKTRA